MFEAGSINFSGGPNSPVPATTFGTLNASVGAVLLPPSPIAQTQSTGIDPTTGRFTFTLSQGSYPALHFAGYTVDGFHLLLLSTDSHKNTYLLSGTASQ